MEVLRYVFPAKIPVKHKAHVGVVSSGNLEVILLPASGNESCVDINTKFEGHGVIWEAVLERFFLENDCLVNIEINDFGATPGVVSLRLLQALEVASRDKE